MLYEGREIEKHGGHRPPPGDWTLVGTPDSVTAQASKFILVTLSFRHLKIGLRSGPFAVLQTSSGLKGRRNLALSGQPKCPISRVPFGDSPATASIPGVQQKMWDMLRFSRGEDTPVSSEFHVFEISGYSVFL